MASNNMIASVSLSSWEDLYPFRTEAINRHGGDAVLVHLPEIGIKGNSHFLMQEKNNKEIMKLALDWLHSKGLDGRE